eukprot:516230_1
MTCFDNYDKLHIPMQISNEIVLYTELKECENLWISIYHKLGQFAFMMKSPSTMEEIRAFESQCSISDYKLPHKLRISLLHCNFVQMPSIFNHSLQSSTDLNSLHRSEIILESFINPLHKWCPIKTMLDSNEIDAVSHFEEIQEYLENFYDDEQLKDTAQRICQWFDEDSTDFPFVYNIGFQGRCDDFDFDVEGYTIGVYLNVKSNLILMNESKPYDSSTQWWTIDQFFATMRNINASYIQPAVYELNDLCISAHQLLSRTEVEKWVRVQSNYDFEEELIEKITNVLL